jgi:hypothetical protein
MAHSSPDKRKSTRGCGSMSADRRHQIASLGGESVPREKRSFSSRPNSSAKPGEKVAGLHIEIVAQGCASACASESLRSATLTKPMSRGSMLPCRSCTGATYA